MRSDTENKTVSWKFIMLLVVVSQTNFTGVSGVVVSGYYHVCYAKKGYKCVSFYGLHVACFRYADSFCVQQSLRWLITYPYLNFCSLCNFGPVSQTPKQLQSRPPK